MTVSRGKRPFRLLVVGLTLILAAFAVVGLGGGIAKAQTPFFSALGGSFSVGPFSGMMGNGSYGDMIGGSEPGGMMSGMMGGYGWGTPSNGNGSPISIDQATQDVQNYLTAWGNPDLVAKEILEFQNNFYAEVQEKSTGVNAFEVLVDKYTGAVYPEMGPNMMWNTKYGMMSYMGGMMGGMMGGYYGSGTPTAQMPVAAQQAEQIAQKYLDQYFPGNTTEDADTFYGYYTIHTLQGGKVSGMLSVNGYSGSVWYHTWHGTFVQEKPVGQITPGQTSVEK